jgi:hypothetical protein
MPMLISGALSGLGAPLVVVAAAAVAEALGAAVVADAADVALLEPLLSLPHAARANTRAALITPGNDHRRTLVRDDI